MVSVEERIDAALEDYDKLGGPDMTPEAAWSIVNYYGSRELLRLLDESGREIRQLRQQLAIK